MPDLVRFQLPGMVQRRGHAQRWRDGIGEDVRDAVLEATNGFNGLRVSGDRHEAYFDPEWQGDDYDYAAESDS